MTVPPSEGVKIATRCYASKTRNVNTTKAQVFHLRYLACILRLADILEFDPERTPEVIFQHRNIARGSRIYWHKDHQISFKLDKNRIIIDAQPPDAQLHRAIEVTADEIERDRKSVV